MDLINLFKKYKKDNSIKILNNSLNTFSKEYFSLNILLIINLN